ncbi:hypothetical protein CH330_03200 [candidate division WOR-3 bacterium JGI_Cruoil_03_51_56]|uniref:RNase H type-1 domain-containing protein n=1 Tax=candidate division WOR-3 bacterium JGI_Cruoil_03_51_56 TaxID=1973747 RepID=A0A235BVC2_UNCW3|nr:MAG: hypothetical protein CH330_03200 [candidate division WOR-3 bacterium JGI_Cruoil_03_51_56]
MPGIRIEIDGSSRFNPGPAGIGVRIVEKDGSVIKEISRFVGIRTNNQAEYEALLCGLRQALNFAARPIIIQTDSELIYRQVKGSYKVRNEELKRLHTQTRKLLAMLPHADLRLVPRKLNQGADKLARNASARKRTGK